jgi:hypothetical protein
MKVDDFIKKQRIKKIYAYHEEKKDKNTVSFGWVPSKSLDLNNPVVVSSVSKSKKVSDPDKEWSEKEGNNAASLLDYNKYFQSLTGDSPDDFVTKWELKEDELEELRKRANKMYREEEGIFLLSLAKLLSEGVKFSKFGRVYKIIDPNT